MRSRSQGLVAEMIWCQLCHQKYCGFDSRLGHFATPLSKEFNLTMLTLTVAVIVPPRWAGELS